MEKRQLGRSGLEVTVLTMGCWQAGKSQWTGANDEDSIAAIRAAHEVGINFFDTAEVYGEGHSERIVGQALAEVRDEVLIATKVGVGNLAGDKVKEACEGSLQRLGTDRIDLYQIHWPAGTWGTPLVPLAETMGALMELKEQGKIRAIGVSNFKTHHIEEALQFGRVDSLQPPYSLFWRPFVFNGTIETCIKHNIGVIAYSPLAQGLLTGKFSVANRPAESDNRAHNSLFKGATYEHALQAVEGLKPIAAKYERTTGQLALQWLLSQPGMTSAIVGARTPEQVRDNAKSADFKISAEDLAAIDKLGHSVTDSLPEDKTNPWT